MTPLILRGGRVLDPVSNRDELADVILADGVVSKIVAPGTAAEGTAVDVSGLLVCPGLIDIHVHLREPGYEYKETIETGTQAAVAGGVTSVVAMPNTKPAPDSAVAVQGFYTRAKGAACRVYTVGTITTGRSGQHLAEMGDMIAAGAVGFSDDGDPVANTRVMLNALEYSRLFDKPIVSHSEDKDLAEGGHMNEGSVSADLAIRGIPDVAESIAITRDVALAEYVGARLHIAHVSAAESVEVIRRAKARGKAAITAETAPHYLMLTDEEVRTFSTNAKMNPPLRTAADQEALIEGLRDGTIDAIATDHAPHAPEEKETEFDAAPFGIIGLETSLAVVWTRLVKTGVLSPMQVIEKMSASPARIHGLPGGSLAPGAPADVTVIDPERVWTVPASFRSLSRNSPFVGRELTGRAVLTIVDGDVRFDPDGRA